MAYLLVIKLSGPLGQINGDSMAVFFRRENHRSMIQTMGDVPLPGFFLGTRGYFQHVVSQVYKARHFCHAGLAKQSGKLGPTDATWGLPSTIFGYHRNAAIQEWQTFFWGGAPTAWP